MGVREDGSDVEATGALDVHEVRVRGPVKVEVSNAKWGKSESKEEEGKGKGWTYCTRRLSLWVWAVFSAEGLRRSTASDD